MLWLLMVSYVVYAAGQKLVLSGVVAQLGEGFCSSRGSVSCD